jgi:hypothetical protein
LLRLPKDRHPSEMNLTLTNARFTVCQLPARAPLPAWATDTGGFHAVTRTADELSIVCAEGIAPAGVKQEPGWRLFEIEGPIDFALTGVLASVLDPLARAGIGIFALSTFNTDYVLVKAGRADAAVAALRAAGHAVKTPASP